MLSMSMIINKSQDSHRSKHVVKTESVRVGFPRFGANGFNVEKHIFIEK